MTTPAATAVAQQQDEAVNETLLEEVTVTARKRAESLQAIPESIQAISSEQILQGGLYSMDDYIRFIPSMSYVAANPGNAVIVFRGIADAQNPFIAEPSAAIYLDEQSLVMRPQSSPRMVDIEQVEALSGPQGTLYGASAQSGVLRINTNKPDPTAFDGWVDLSARYMSAGDPSYDASAMVNIPMGDSFAVRLVGFTARDGGFIDIVEGTTVPWEVYTNEDAVRENFNEVDHKGGRLSARWFINDEWTVTGGVVYQKTESVGRPEHDPVYAGDLNLVRFRPDHEFDEQDWTQYALTVEGDLGFADFVSATTYFTRDWEYQQDTSVGYTAYFGTFCNGYNYYFLYSRYCFQPAYVSYYGNNDAVGYLSNRQKNTKFSQEFRLFHKGERFDWLAGLYYEDADEEWDFDSFTEGYNESQAMVNYLAGRMLWAGNPIPERLPDNAWWFSADRTNWKQWAVFGELTWHLTDRWDLTAGARWFDRKMDKIFWLELPKYNIDDEGFNYPSSDESDWVPKLSATWRITDQNLVYALYSEGFRPGGTNRGRGNPFFPRQYDADKLENFEIGTKNTLLNGRMRLNATYFDMQWKDYQLEVVDPSNLKCDNPNAPPPPACGQTWQKVVTNVGNASTQGLEVQLDIAASDVFTLGANGTWLDAKLDDDVQLGLGDPVPAGSRLPLTPEFKGSFYAQADWPVDWFNGGNAWLRLQWSYVGDMLNQVEPLTIDDSPSPQILQPAYNIGDFRMGFDASSWSVQLFINNLTDERAVLFANPYEFDYFFGRSRITVNRPREAGVRLIYRFGQ